MGRVELELSPEARGRLATKGQILYGKFCGTGGRGICAESFALYHIWQGQPEVARDLLTFLDGRIAALRIEDSEGRLPLAVELADRIRRHLEVEGDDPPPPSAWAGILKAKKQTGPPDLRGPGGA